MASLRFRCHHCFRKIEVDERGAGLEVPCPECHRSILIPSRDEAERLAERQKLDTQPIAALPTIKLSLSGRRRVRRYRVVAAAWIFLVVAAVVAFQWRSALFVASTLLLASFILSIAVFAQRHLVHGALILACALCLVPVLFPGIIPPTVKGKPLYIPVLREVERIVVVTQEVAVASQTVSEEEEEDSSSSPASKPIEPSLPAVSKADRSSGSHALPFRVYTDCDDGVQPYTPSGWMGNISDIDIDECCAQNPRSGASCIKSSYMGKGKWAGVVWQDPPNNWGDMPGGYDLTGARRLTFWARGVTGSEKVEFKIGLLGVSKQFCDSAKATTGKIQLTTQWKQYTLDLGGKNLQRIITGFSWIVEGGATPVTFYLDDIQYE